MKKFNWQVYEKNIARHIRMVGQKLTVFKRGSVSMGPDGEEIKIPDVTVHMTGVVDQWKSEATPEGVNAGDLKIYAAGSDMELLDKGQYFQGTSWIITKIQPVAPGGVTTHYIISAQVYGA